MTFDFQIVELKKLYPLAISRGISTGSRNLFVFASDGTHTGVGECAPGTGYDETLVNVALPQLQAFTADIEGLNVQEVYAAARERQIDPTALAGLEVALWDLLAKRANMPLYRLLGLGRTSVPSSVTIGINPPEVIRERVPEILTRTGGKYLKVKLGSPGGTESDKENFLAAKESSAPFGAVLRVDANGGWSVDQAQMMMRWLADNGADYCEQPLKEGNEDGLPHLFKGRALPIYVDESCRFATDVAKVAHCVDGVNLKLMKCGGLSEAMRIVAAARAHGLKTMIGCMGESSVAIAAGAAIGSLFDHIDLDSQLNLNPDPAEGLGWEDGCVVPRDVPGHGAFLSERQNA